MGDEWFPHRVACPLCGWHTADLAVGELCPMCMTVDPEVSTLRHGPSLRPMSELARSVAELRKRNNERAKLDRVSGFGRAVVDLKR